MHVRCNPIVSTFAFAVVAAGVSTSALATTASITLNNTTYEVTTLTGLSPDFASLFPQQPWFGSLSLTNSAAQQVGSSLGLLNILNNDSFGPAFARNFNPPPSNSVGSFFNPSFGTATIDIVPSRTYTFAFVTTTIPEPASLSLLTGAAALMLRRLSR